MNFKTLRVMQLFLVIKVGMPDSLHSIVFILQQKRFNFDLFFRCNDHNGVHSDELNDEVDFLANIGFLTRCIEQKSIFYTLNPDFKSKNMPDLPSDKETKLICRLIGADKEVLANTALLLYHQDYAINNSLHVEPDLMPNLFNNLADAHSFYHEIMNM